MNMSTEQSPWFRRFNKLAAIFAILGVLALLLSGPAYKFGLIPLSASFLMILTGGGLAIASLISGLLALLVGRKYTPKLRGKASFIGIALGAAMLIHLGSWITRSKAMIHDISTDLTNPPEFVAIAPLRANAQNPAAYPGSETADLQRSAYPDIKSVELNASPVEILEAAQAAALAADWEIVAIDPKTGRLEATDTTFWYGYKDDIVVRVRAAGSNTILDIRSKSRVGESDLGTNAARIRDYTQAIKAALQ